MEFVIAQSGETDKSGKERKWLSVVPAQWVVAGGWSSGVDNCDGDGLGNDLMYWPHRSQNHLLMAAEKIRQSYRIRSDVKYVAAVLKDGDSPQKRMQHVRES